MFFKQVLLIVAQISVLSCVTLQFKDPWKMLDPHDPCVGKDIPFKKGVYYLQLQRLERILDHLKVDSFF